MFFPSRHPSNLTSHNNLRDKFKFILEQKPGIVLRPNDNDERDDDDEPGQCLVDKSFFYHLNRYHKHQHNGKRENLYRVRWYGT